MNSILQPRYLLVVLLLIGLMGVSLLPQLTRHFIVDWFNKKGVAITFERFELALLPGRLTIYGLNASNEYKRGLRAKVFVVDIQWLPLLQRQLVIDRLQLDTPELDIHIVGDYREVAGLDIATMRPTQPAASTTIVSAVEPVRFEHFSLSLQQLDLLSPTICVAFSTVSVGSPLTHCIESQGLSLAQGLTFNEASSREIELPVIEISDFRIARKSRVASPTLLSLQNFSSNNISISDRQLVIGHSTFTDMAVNHAGLLPEYMPLLPTTGVLQTLKFDGFKLRDIGEQPSGFISNISLRELSLTKYAEKLLVLESGHLSALAFTPDSLALELLELAQLNADFSTVMADQYPNAPSQVQLSLLSAYTIALTRDHGETQVNLDTLALDNLSLWRADRSIATLHALILSQIMQRGDNTTIASVAADKLRLLPRKKTTPALPAEQLFKHYLAANHITVEGITVANKINNSAVKATLLHVNGIELLAAHNAQQTFDIIEQFQVLSASRTPPQLSQEVQTPLHLQLDQFIVNGDNHILWVDRALTPVTEQSIIIQTASVDNIDSHLQGIAFPLQGSASIDSAHKVSFSGDGVFVNNQIHLTINGYIAEVNRLPTGLHIKHADIRRTVDKYMAQDYRITIAGIGPLTAHAYITLHRESSNANNHSEYKIR